MTHFPLIDFGEHLREDRKRAGLTQEELAEKVELSDKRLSASYVSKMETGLLPPPSRKAAEGLADALGMSKRPVTLYITKKDIAALRRFTFFLEANVAGAEDVQAIGLAEIEDDKVEQEEERSSGTPTYSMLNAAIGLDSLLETTGDQINEIKRLLDSLSLTDEEEDMVAPLLDTTKRLLKFIAAQHKMRKEG